MLISHKRFGSGPEVIFLHGWGGDLNSFLGVANVLSKKYCVTLVSFHGFGDTPEPSKPFVLDDYVYSILKIIRFYKMESVSLVCHSFGGRVGIKLAYKYPYLVDKLVLVDVAGMKPRRTILYYLKVCRHKVCKMLHISIRDGSSDYQKLSYVMKRTFVNIVNEHLDFLCKKITLPTLLVWGNKDTETPIYMGRRIRRNIKTSKLIIFDGCGHFAYLEWIKIFIQLVDRFLGKEFYADCYWNSYLFNRSDYVISAPHGGAKK